MRKGKFIWLARGDGKLIRVWWVEIRKVTGNCDKEVKRVYERRSYDGSVIVYEDDDESEEFKIELVIMRYMKPLTLFQDLCKTNVVERGRLLGLDVGDKYVGLAVSDPQNKIATPLSVLKFNIELMAADFTSLISEFSLSGFVVGCPFDRQRLSLDGVQVKVFADDLCKTGKLAGVKYTYWNECFTSKNVDLLLKPLTLHPVELKTMLDKFAAVGILQKIAPAWMVDKESRTMHCLGGILADD